MWWTIGTNRILAWDQLLGVTRWYQHQFEPENFSRKIIVVEALFWRSIAGKAKVELAVSSGASATVHSFKKSGDCS